MADLPSLSSHPPSHPLSPPPSPPHAPPFTPQVNFTSSTGEEAELGSLNPGDQFGYDAVLGELHDTTVRCTSDVEVFAVPREQLQKAFTQDSYLQSVWQAPAQRSMQLRRQMSQALATPGAGSVKGKAGSSSGSSGGGSGGSSSREPSIRERVHVHTRERAGERGSRHRV